MLQEWRNAEHGEVQDSLYWERKSWLARVSTPSRVFSQGLTFLKGSCDTFIWMLLQIYWLACK